MMPELKKLIMFLLLINIVHSIQGQNTETDSLKKLLRTLPESPQRVLVLEGLSYAYVSAYPDTALQYALKGLELAQKINDPIGEAYCTNALGNVYFGVGDYPKALEMMRRIGHDSVLNRWQRTFDPSGADPLPRAGRNVLSKDIPLTAELARLYTDAHG